MRFFRCLRDLAASLWDAPHPTSEIYSAWVVGVLDGTLEETLLPAPPADEDLLALPAVVQGNGWCGAVIAATGPTAPGVMRAGELVPGDAMRASPDDVAEFFDSECAYAREAWETYRSLAARAGVEVPEGSILFVVGTVRPRVRR